MKTDATIQDDVIKELKWEPSVIETHIGVTARQGIVTLTGYVTSFAEKNGAEKAAKRVNGVAAIANELHVKLAMEDKLSDEDIASACIRALRANTYVPMNDLRIIVRDGWVTLEGEVDWQFQRAAAFTSVCVLRGVEGVINSIRVKAYASNEDIKEKIVHALKRRAEIDANKVKVATFNNKVVLSGTVHSWNEKEEVEQAAWSAPGVSEVTNDLVVNF